MKSTALDLLTVRDKVVKLQTLDIPGYSGVGYSIQAGRFEKDIVIFMRAAKYGPHHVQIVCWYEGLHQEVAMIVPNEFVMEILPESESKTISDLYFGFQLRTLPSQLSMSYSSGADPEMFVETGKGELIPAFKFLDKKPDKPVFKYNGTNDIYWDGFQAEFTVTAGTCVGHLLDRMQLGLKSLIESARKYDKTSKLSAKTVFDIPIPELNAAAPEHVAFGCMPSKNAYGLKGIEAPGNEVLYRTAGGHLHFGFDSNRNEETIIRMVKALDAIVGVAGVSLFAQFDSARRREMYGLAGEYRTPAYGLEYRVLSNAWLFHPLISNIIYDLARPAATVGMKNLLGGWKATESETIAAINNHDIKLAREILSRNEPMLKKVLQNKILEPQANFVFNIIMNGMESAILNPTDIETNWMLNGNRWKTHCSGFGKYIANAYEMNLDGVKKF